MFSVLPNSQGFEMPWDRDLEALVDMQNADAGIEAKCQSLSSSSPRFPQQPSNLILSQESKQVFPIAERKGGKPGSKRLSDRPEAHEPAAA